MMKTYVIGDIQGCYKTLKRLLTHIDFKPNQDHLWFVGDLVNRGKHSLDVLRFVSDLNDRAIVVLGNHDLHLLAVYHHAQPPKKSDTFFDVLDAADADQLCRWLQGRRLMHWDREHQRVLIHAGLPPIWSITEAHTYSDEVYQILQKHHAVDFLRNMYGNEPNTWSEELAGYDRLRLITSYFTRMRFCTEKGTLELTSKSGIEDAPSGYRPWFEFAARHTAQAQIFFGHWARLRGLNRPNLIGLDTGCAYGGELTAYTLETRAFHSVKSEG